MVHACSILTFFKFESQIAIEVRDICTKYGFREPDRHSYFENIYVGR